MDLNLTNSQIPIVVSVDQVAENNRNYTVIENATFTDPTPEEGKGFKVFVRNGTAIIGGDSFTQGSFVFRIYYDGAFLNVQIDQTLAQTLERGNETFSNDIILTELDRIVVGANRAGLSKGTFDTSRGGDKGVSLHCIVGYELNFQAGFLRMYLPEGDGTPLPINSDSEIVYTELVPTTPTYGTSLITKDYADTKEPSLGFTPEDVANKKIDLTDNSDTFYPTQKAVKTALDLKVDAVAGKGLSENDFTNTLKTKLDGIEDGAQVNVNADWNATSGDAEILNKPTIPSVASLVPYTGATQDVDLGEFELKAGQVEFDQTPTGTAGVAVMRWNDTDGTIDLGLKGGNVTLQVGQEQVLRVVNKTATNINLLEANYQAVRVTGAQGQRLKVDLAQATTDALSAETIGLVTETINNNQEGFITTSGIVRGINTTGSLQGETWADGDIVYLSPTTAGRITNIKPSAPNHLIIIGYVISAHATQGSIFVKVDNGYELDELHNVAITTPLNNQSLVYETSTTLWKNKALTTAEIADSSNKRYQTDAQKTDFTNPKITVECIDALTVDFYAMYSFQIDSVTAITNSPTTTILVNNSAYTFGVSIATGAKITVTLNTAGVVNLNTTRL